MYHGNHTIIRCTQGYSVEIIYGDVLCEAKSAFWYITDLFYIAKFVYEWIDSFQIGSNLLKFSQKFVPQLGRLIHE